MSKMTEEQKDRYIKQASNIRISEVLLEKQLKSSDGDVIDSEEMHLAAIYNLETISTEEVERLVKTEEGRRDPRFLLADYEVVKNIFPHMGEREKDGQK